MNGRGFMTTLTAATFGIALLTSTQVQAQRFDVSGFAGGLLGGAIAGAMINGQRRPGVVYRPRTVYRPAPRYVTRHYAAPAHPRTAPTTSAAVVDPGADPFSAKASAAALPASAKP